jgi:hypothetical protein
MRLFGVGSSSIFVGRIGGHSGLTWSNVGGKLHGWVSHSRRLHIIGASLGVTGSLPGIDEGWHASVYANTWSIGGDAYTVCRTAAEIRGACRMNPVLTAWWWGTAYAVVGVRAKNANWLKWLDLRCGPWSVYYREHSRLVEHLNLMSLPSCIKLLRLVLPSCRPSAYSATVIIIDARFYNTHLCRCTCVCVYSEATISYRESGAAVPF